MALINEIDQNLNVFGTQGNETTLNPETLAGLGLGGSFYANQIAQNTAARQGFQLVGSPQTTSTAGRLMGGTAPQYTGQTPPPRMSPGTQVVPTGQPPAVQTIKPAQVTSVKPIAPTQLATTARASNALNKANLNPLLLGYTLADVGTQALTGESLSNKIGTTLGSLAGTALYGDTSQPAITPEESALMGQGINPVTGTTIQEEPNNIIALEPIIRKQAQQPEATFTLPSGEVRSIMPGQDVASAFGQESGRPMTFQVDGGEVTVPSAQAIQTMNLGEQAEARQAQQDFLASPAAREMSNRMLQSVAYNDPFAQASAEREAQMAAKPDFMRAVSDRERRGTGEMSMASATKLTEGDRDKARAMIELQRQGRDPMTGKKEEEPFKPQVVEMGGRQFAQLTPEYYQMLPEEPTPDVPFEPRSIEVDGETLYEVSPNRFSFKPRSSKEDNNEPLFPVASNKADLPEVTNAESYNTLKSGDKYIYEGKEYTKQ